MPRSSPYSRLYRQMLVVLLAFSLLPLLAMGVAGFLAVRGEVEDHARSTLEGTVKNRRVTVEVFLEEKLRTLELLASSIPVERLSSPVFLEELLEQLRRERGGIIDLGLIGEDGRHIAYAGPYSLQDKNYSGQDWFHQVMVRGRWESDVFLGFRRFPHMVMAVKRRAGGRDVVLRATIDTGLLSELVREGGLESGFDIFVLNRDGEFQTESDAHHLMDRADVGPLPRHSGVRVEGLNGAGELVATTWLKGDTWVLVARRPAPRLSALLGGHPLVVTLFVAGLALLPLVAHLVARLRVRQFRAIEATRAALLESAAQSQKMAVVGRLAAGVAHDINNPLAIIDAQVGVLTDTLEDGGEAAPTEQIRARLRSIQSQVARARSVTHRLLGFSRRVGPDREPVDVVTALEETVGFVERDAEASRIVIVREFEPGLPIIRSSVSQLQQVFLNLINNAMDAIGRDGRLVLRVGRSGGQLEVAISDDGPGIPPASLERIFEPFYSTKEGKGTHSGLGLAICKEIVTNLGGTISVASTPGEGTTFAILLPLAVSAEEEVYRGEGAKGVSA